MEHVGPNQLDRGTAREQTMARQPDFAHPALAKTFDELISAKCACFANLPTQSVQKAGRDDRKQRARVVRVEHQQR